ncbi:hypothetical protein [Micromonospora sp. NPDC005113]
MSRCLIVLLPTARSPRWAVLERALEAVEARRGWFAVGDIHKALGSYPQGWSATNQVIKELMAHGLLDTKGQYSQIRYRVRAQGGTR